MIAAMALAVLVASTAEAQAAEPQATCPPPPPCPECPPCPAVAPPPRPKHWVGSVGLGLVSVTGNARSLTATVAAAIEHRGDQFILGGKLNGIYGESRAAGMSVTETSAENASLFLRGDYRFSPRLSGYLLTGAETDHPRSIEIRYSQEVGAAYAWIDTKRDGHKLFLRTDLGFRVAEEYRFQYFPVAARVDPRVYNLKAPRAGAAFRWEPNQVAVITQDFEVLPNADDGRLLVNGITKLSTKIFGPIAVGVSYTVNYDSAPPVPKIPWDTTLAITFDYVL